MTLKIIDARQSARWLSCFENYRKFILEKYKTHKKIENYKARYFNVQDLLGLFLIVHTEKDYCIVGFVSVQTPKHWPQNVARICNRMWIDPEYRLPGLSLKAIGKNLRYGSNWGNTITYKDQINCCLKNNIDMAVITRENMKGPDKKNDLPSIYNRFKILKPDWKLDEKYYLTCPEKNSYQCWQRLVYLEINKGLVKDLLKQIPNISCEEYHKKFVFI